MKAVFEIAIAKHEVAIARLETEIDFVPVSGMQVEDDDLWDRPVKIKSVCYIMKSKSLYITLEDYHVENPQLQELLLKAYENGGWKIL